MTIRLNENINKKIKLKKLRLDSLANSFVIKNPMIIYENKKQKIDIQKENLTRILNKKIDSNKNLLNHLKKSYILNNPENLYNKQIIKLENLIEKLKLVNPLETLKRGYTLTTQDNKIIKSIKDIDKQKNMTIKLHDGEVETEIKNIKEYSNE